MNRLCPTWHAIIPLGQHKWSDEIGCGIPSLHIDKAHDRTTSGVACHHIPWTAHTMGRLRAWEVIIAHGQHTRLDEIGFGMPSSPLYCTYTRMTSGVECHPILWKTHTVGRNRMWHSIIVILEDTLSNDIGRAMSS